MTHSCDIRLGAERLLAGDVSLSGLRWDRTALVTHAAAVTADLRPTLEGLIAAGCLPAAIVTPEHGFSGAGAPGSAEVPGAVIDGGDRVRVIDGYLLPPAELAERLDGIELMLVDLSDLGVRCSTYLTLLDDVLAAAGLLGARVVVLDRPNPLGRAVAGPRLEPDLRSYVGRLLAPLRHGLTIGEAALTLAPRDVELEVITVTGWDGEHGHRPWVAPAPNLPTADAALCYAGTVLLEGVLGAEPRGTASPFATVGGEWIDRGVVDAVRARALPGLAVRAVTISPMWGPSAGRALPGIAWHVVDHAIADPVRATIELLCAGVAAGHELAFSEHFDQVSGSRDLAGQVRDGWDAERICAGWSHDDAASPRRTLYEIG